ncbi:class I SAM-dependent methyltransferase [Aestuariispira ectoiniformans]|uniref:class I SAM-dependent methyltransferase n=1 Tax=Aestuariispira ectoiniformans TaxID=2775080 RepID=UPI00223AC7C6|nr:class I SAM-dependent methyltransferase [Aestuariispira ectoiniformans]
MDDFDETALPSPPEPGKPWDKELVHWYVWHYGEHPFNHMAVDFAELTGPETVLDIGCDSGSALRHACRFLSSGQAIGIDPSPEMVQVAAKQSQNHRQHHDIRFETAGAEAIPLPDDSVDVALAINSLHHWQDRTGALAEVRRVLKPGGRMILVEEIFADTARGMDDLAIQQQFRQASFEAIQGPPLESGGDKAYIFQCYPTDSQRT